MFSLRNLMNCFRPGRISTFDPSPDIVQTYVKNAQNQGVTEITLVLQQHVPPLPLQITASDNSNRVSTFDVCCTRTMTVYYTCDGKLVEKSRIDGFDENSLELQDKIVSSFKQFPLTGDMELQITEDIDSNTRTLLIKVPSKVETDGD